MGFIAGVLAARYEGTVACWLQATTVQSVCVSLGLEGIVGSSVVQIVAHAAHYESQSLQL